MIDLISRWFDRLSRSRFAILSRLRTFPGESKNMKRITHCQEQAHDARGVSERMDEGSTESPLLHPPGRDVISTEDWVAIGQALKLSPREFQVTTLLAEGKTRSQIAEELHVSLGTIRVYLERIFEKAGARSKLELYQRCVYIQRNSRNPGNMTV